MKYKVIGGSLNVREGKSLDTSIIHVLNDGEIFEAGSEKDGWLKLAHGYCMARYAEPVPEPAEEQSEEEQPQEETEQKKPAKKKAAK